MATSYYDRKRTEAWGLSRIARGLLKKNEYRRARALLDHVVQLYRAAGAGGVTLPILSETLFYGEAHFPSCGIDWYSLLHLPPPVTDAKVKSRSQVLIKHLNSINVEGLCKTQLFREDTIDNIKTATQLIEQSVSILCCQSKRFEFDRKRKESGLLDFPPTITENVSFTEEYFQWESPIFIGDIPNALHSNKRARYDSPISPVDGESSLCPRLQKLKNQVFDEMSQNPHYAPVMKYSCKVREGMMFGLDVVFTNLCEEIRNLEDPQMLWSKFDGFIEQMTELEEMGYNVEKLRERLGKLKEISELDRANQVLLENFEAEVKEQQKKIDMKTGKINDLKKDSVEALNEFASIAKSSWK